MIERQIVASNVKELEIQEYITANLKNLGHSHIKLQKTPLGEKIIIHASRPGLIVGRKGQNIKKLTEDLKEKFKLENPQIEINEVESPDLDAQIVAERIAGSLEKFGTQRFKGVGHKVMADVMNAGALGVEILVTGKIPSSRAKRWRFYQGYLKKCGDIAIVGVRKAYAIANLKTGTVGIQVRIMPPDIKLPDDVQMTGELQEAVEEVKAQISKKDNDDKKKPKKDDRKAGKEEGAKDEKKEKPKKEKKAVKKAPAKKEEKQEAPAEEEKAETAPEAESTAEEKPAESTEPDKTE
ncbi:30S ribosomal protein S3 [Candidatus Woesearchaeota archaeon]|nr:30S ribosomal protein S3 [Candidatus Woesearchaeota archaeon]